MHVGVDEAWQDGAPTRVDPLRARVAGHYFGRRANRSDQVARYGDRPVGHAADAFTLHRQQVCAGDDQVNRFAQAILRHSSLLWERNATLDCGRSFTSSVKTSGRA